MDDFTLVLGADKKHLQQLAMVFPTWKRHKPSIFERKTLVFYDRFQLKCEDVFDALGSGFDMEVVPWPTTDRIVFPGDENNKWYHPQRYKMLAGFVHVPAKYVTTSYWLKLDTDVVATENDDWILPEWFENNPAIVAQGWAYTKPPDQMTILEDWIEKNRDHIPEIAKQPRLNLIPEPGANKVKHKRIISWCGFFNTQYTKLVSEIAKSICGPCSLPVPSQDGYLWYMAKRCELEIIRADMKSRGWQWWSTMRNVEKHSKEAMESVTT